jgi:hypothetical protein
VVAYIHPALRSARHFAPLLRFVNSFPASSANELQLLIIVALPTLRSFGTAVAAMRILAFKDSAKPAPKRALTVPKLSPTPTRSYWLARGLTPRGAPVLPLVPQPAKHHVTDVTIVGSGIAG